ncbi:MAG TPA: hypothetical protein VIG66_05075, partial [Noviherbaspirillum sp.]
MKILAPLALFLTALSGLPAAASGGADTKPPTKKASEKAAAKKSAAGTGAAESTTVDTSDMQRISYDCDLGNKIIIFKKPDEDKVIALHWQKRVHRLERIATSTGADRFENAENGLVWIGIPAKGMLLDSKKGRQLANECRNEEQKKVVQK